MCVVLLAGAVTWFVVLETVSPLYFLWDDNATYFLPLFLFNAQELWTSHTVSIINFFQFAGWNHLGAGQPGVLYAPAYLAVWIATVILDNPLATIDVLCIGHLLGGMIAMYLWLKFLGARRFIAACGALFYLTLPFASILSRAWVVVSYVHFFAPSCLLLLGSDVRSPSWKKIAGYGVLKALFISSGYPQYLAYLTVIEIVYMFLLLAPRSKGDRLSVVVRFCMANAIAAFLALPLLLPMAEAVMLSADRSAPIRFVVSNSGMINIWHVLAAQVVLIYEFSPFVGLNTMFHLGGFILLPLLLWKILQVKTPIPSTVRTMTVLGLTAFLFSGPLNMLLSLLPVFDRFRWPFKMFFFSGLLYTIVLFLTLEWLRSQKKLTHRTVMLFTCFCLLSNVVLFLHPPRAPFRLETVTSPLPAYMGNDFRSLALVHSLHDADMRTLATQPMFNYPTLWRSPALTGYDPLVSRVHADIGSGDREGFSRSESLPDIIDHLSRWSVRYLIADAPIEPATMQVAGLRRLSDIPDEFIYENPAAEPIASFTHTPTIVVPVEYHTNRMRLRTNGGTGTVLLRIAPIDGYALTKPDGSTADIVLTDGGVLIPMTTEEDFVDIVYRSRSFDMGLFILKSGLIIFVPVIIALSFFARRRKRMPQITD